MSPATNRLLAALPDTFRHSEALQHISERQLRNLTASYSKAEFYLQHSTRGDRRAMLILRPTAFKTLPRTSLTRFGRSLSFHHQQTTVSALCLIVRLQLPFAKKTSMRVCGHS